MTENSVCIPEGKPLWIPGLRMIFPFTERSSPRRMRPCSGNTERIFEHFSWKVYDGKRTGAGERTESRSTGNGETVVQLWSLSDGSCLRVTASRIEPDGDWKFEYQYRYKTGMFGMPRRHAALIQGGGLHRIDRIPEGYYVLVETETPGAMKRQARGCWWKKREPGDPVLYGEQAQTVVCRQD